MDFAGSLNYYDGSSYTAASSGASQSWYRAGQAAMPGTERHQNLQWTLPKVCGINVVLYMRIV